MTPKEARRQIDQLHKDLLALCDRDPEQEVRDMALPVIDAVIMAVREVLQDGDLVLSGVQDVISPEAIASGDPVRAADVLIVAGALKARLGPQPGAASVPLGSI